MADKKETLQQVMAALAEVLKVTQISAPPETLLFADLRLRSIDFVELISDLESRFQVNIHIGELLQTAQHRPGRRYGEISIGEVAAYFQSRKP